MGESGAWPRTGVRTIVNRDFHSNTYLLATGHGSDCVVVDPGLDRDAIAKDLAESGWRPKAVLCTHGHFDHVGSAAWLQASFDLPVHLLGSDLKLARMSNFMLAAFKLEQRITLPRFEAQQDGAAVACGALSLRFHALPGHTPGSAAIAVGDLLFSGDSLYARRTALSRLPGEDHALLRASLNGLFGWVDASVRVLPGHGGSATIADIRAHNEELRAFLAAGAAP